MNGRHDSGMACKSLFSHAGTRYRARADNSALERRSERDSPQEIPNCSERLRNTQLGTNSSRGTSGYSYAVSY